MFRNIVLSYYKYKQMKFHNILLTYYKYEQCSLPKNHYLPFVLGGKGPILKIALGSAGRAALVVSLGTLE